MPVSCYPVKRTVRKLGFIMKNRKIVADSSANLLELPLTAFQSAALKIITADREFVDDKALELDSMIDYFSTYKGKSQTSCPNVEDWLNAFGDADEVFCITITSGLSGSYNSAIVAKNHYEEEHPGRRVFVIDSLSAGPELTLIAEKLQELLHADKTYEEICAYMPEYQKKTGLLFSLESLKNLAANGRVSPAVAKIAGLLGIRVVGKASEEGTLEPMDKCRGEARAVTAVLKHLKEDGLKLGRVHIAHCHNENAANALKAMIEAELRNASVTIGKTMGLCSYYAERGGLMIGYEKY